MKHVIFTISLLALVSCKDSKNQETLTNTNTIETTNEDLNEAASNLYTNVWVNEIKNDEGAKWQADAMTNEGVKKMQNTIKMQETNTLEDYNKLAIQLNDDKNFVIKNCTMKGASHDNLHIWLHPLIEKIDALIKVKDVKDAAKLKHSIEENIHAYDAYFQ